MPVLANNLSLTAGSSSVNIFDNTNYQFVNEGTEIRVSAAVVGANDGVQGSNVNYRFTINNTEFADDAIVPTLVTGCLLYTSPSPRDRTRSRMPSSA